jgi:hypothetical protein
MIFSVVRLKLFFFSFLFASPVSNIGAVIVDQVLTSINTQLENEYVPYLNSNSNNNMSLLSTVYIAPNKIVKI